jgi:hypothetical protein
MALQFDEVAELLHSTEAHSIQDCMFQILSPLRNLHTDVFAEQLSRMHRTASDRNILLLLATEAICTNAQTGQPKSGCKIGCPLGALHDYARSYGDLALRTRCRGFAVFQWWMFYIAVVGEAVSATYELIGGTIKTKNGFRICVHH